MLYLLCHSWRRFGVHHWLWWLVLSLIKMLVLLLCLNNLVYDMSTSGWFWDTLFKISVLMDGMWYYSNFPKLKKKQIEVCPRQGYWTTYENQCGWDYLSLAQIARICFFLNNYASSFSLPSILNNNVLKT